MKTCPSQLATRPNTYRIRALHTVRLTAEVELLLAGEHLEDQLAVENRNSRPEPLQFLMQHAASLLDLLARQIRTALGRSLHHIREADAQLQHFAILFGRPRFRRQTGQVQAFPEMVAGPGIVVTFVRGI